MSKKSKRQARREVIQPSTKPATEPLVSGRPTGFNPDYQFVLKDIRRVGILAGSFIVILVALSFFLR